MNEWALATPATAVPPEILPDVNIISVVFSRDSTRALTLFGEFNHFAVWSVPDGQLLAVNPGDPGGDAYDCADFGVPGSASDGLVAFGFENATCVDLWSVYLPTEGGPSRPRLRSRVHLGHVNEDGNDSVYNIKLSPDGSKFAAMCIEVAYVYDVASLTRIGTYAAQDWPDTILWSLDNRRVLVSCEKGVCVWDFSRPEAPAIITILGGPDALFHSWSPSGTSYFVTREFKGQGMFALEERRAAGGLLVHTIDLGPCEGFPRVSFSTDAHALLVEPPLGVPARVVVVD